MPQQYLNAEQADELQDACDALNLSLRHGYSGRGMMGRTCIGIVGGPQDGARLVSYLTSAGSELADLFNAESWGTDSLGLNTIIYWPYVALQPVKQYTVSVANSFEATSPEDAIRQMIAWLDDNAWAAGYRVTVEGEDESIFIDAERLGHEPDWVEG